MNRKEVKILILCYVFMLFSLAVYSQKPPPTPGQKGKNGLMALDAPPPPPPGLPIDGGLSFLLASGLAYGIYALKRRNK